MVLVLLSTSVERCFVSRMRDFLNKKRFNQESLIQNTLQVSMCAGVFDVVNIVEPSFVAIPADSLFFSP